MVGRGISPSAGRQHSGVELPGTIEGQASACERRRPGGRPKAVDDMAVYARSLRPARILLPTTFGLSFVNGACRCE